jgi:predicted metal-binding protein
VPNQAKFFARLGERIRTLRKAQGSPLATDPLEAIWQSDADAGQTFRFKLDGESIYVYGSQQELLGTLQAKGKNRAVEAYQGLVQIAPVTDCPGGRGLMQIKSWNDTRLDARIEKPIRSSAGITCGGVLGTGKLVPWQNLTFVKR